VIKRQLHERLYDANNVAFIVAVKDQAESSTATIAMKHMILNDVITRDARVMIDKPLDAAFHATYGVGTINVVAHGSSGE
jgi:hypothetical protein